MELEFAKTSDPNGRETLGWFITYTPLELIEAAGVRPYRILGATNTVGRATALLQGNVCSYVLSALDNALDGGYQSLCGIVAVNYCDATRRLYDAWVHYLDPPFAHLMDLPKIQTSGAERLFYQELIRLKQALETHFRVTITEERLQKAIVLYNETRALLKQLYEARKVDHGGLTGSQVFKLVQGVMTGDRDNVNAGLRSAVANTVRGRTVGNGDGPRLVLSGSLLADAKYVELIEECGARIVCDDLCMGMKSFAMTVDEDSGDPLRSLSRGYMEKMPSSLIMDAEKRVRNLIRLAEDYRADGIIHQVLKFCNPHITDVPYYRMRLKEAGIPVLFIERDHRLENAGQLKTRIQAFLEMLAL